MSGISKSRHTSTEFMNKRTHVIIPEQLVKEIDRLVGSRRRSSFLTEAAEEKITSLRQLAALDAIKGAWKDSDHPELKQGSAKWVKKLRQETDRRLKKVTTR
jgi:Arc/MetJ-type ribon-helix-helix transcriptional regulator